MKKIQAFFLALMAMLMCYSASLHAEDIDIYVDNASTTGTPNVLFVIDTGANFSSNASVPCTAYADGDTPSLGSTAGGIEQCALVDSLSALTSNVVNIGVMVNNNNNFATDTRSSGDTAYHEVCQGTYGGCLVRKLTLMDSAGKSSLINFIKSWKTSGQDSATSFNVKSGGDRTANMMQEAWAYYNGKIGMSTKNYGTSILASGCQKNFIIFIGNAYNNSGGPADSGSESPYNGTYGMTASQTGATTAQKTKISETVKFSPSTCGSTSAAATTSASNWSENWADEWARLMYQQDGGANGNLNTQNIITYTIGVVDDSGCKTDYPALLSTMAKYGGGKYFKTSTTSDLKLAVQAILNEVQAVNSVFSSASLPVAVNADGSYLNQIFLGMFRPDATAGPRWVGNLKQYQLVRINGDLKLGDATGAAAISSSGTGFISPNAISFWTSKSIASLPDSGGGFFVNDPKGVPTSGYDYPDGEVVEKGGVAQQLRKESLTANYGSTEGSSSNPRRMYVYCPSGSGCNANLTDSSNSFATTNSGIATNAFGSSTSLPITSIVRSGTTALVTTSGNHGFTSGTQITISNAGQTEYNVTQTLTTVNSSTTFTITGLPDYPTTPSAGSYIVSPASASSFAISSMSRTTSASGNKTSETVTVVTSSPHNFTTTSTVVLTGITPSTYNATVTPTAVSTNSFTYSVSISPNQTAQNSYKVKLNSASNAAITGASVSNPSTGQLNFSTTAAHKLLVGQKVTISGTGNNKIDGTYNISNVTSTTAFNVTGLGSSVKNLSSYNNVTITPDTSTSYTISSITRAATTDSALATATMPATAWFMASVGDTKVVDISTTGTITGESAYAQTGVTITCTVASSNICTQFTYGITVTPSSSITLSNATAGVSSGTSQTLTAGKITRSGTTATATGLTANNFTNGQSVTISASGTALTSESAYIGTWTITCTSPCTSFTFGPVTLTPTTPATGTNMNVYSASTPPDKTTLVRWIRGEDNYGDEKGPGGTITVRPSIHGDVLHSRPLVINYGDSRGIVAFYGANDGVYRAVNANQTASIGSVPAGGELWSLVLPEFFTKYNRLRLNSPELKFPNTTLSTAQAKDYFFDGSTGVYQKLNADNTINAAYIYLTMRRGGRFIYALDVTTPTAPKVLWSISNATAGFDEMGQTWSRPKLTLIQSSTYQSTPVLIFGAGYDTQEDSEPPGTDTMGRGIFMVNALTGALIWQANSYCTTSATCRQVSGMNYAIPSEITFVDRDGNGYTDKLYFGDTGGNVWRADISDANSANWTVTKLAALGCSTGTCSSGTTPRKFFFPPSVITVKPGGTSGAYDAISIPSGDREHPLKSTSTGSAYLTSDKFFMLIDTGTSVGTPVTSGLTLNQLTDISSSQAFSYDGSQKGFYISFATGEKGVNAPVAVNGSVYFATNRPTSQLNTCASNLGEAKAYAVNPFTGTTATNVLQGGGMPPSAVAGLVTIVEHNADGTTSSSEEKFCIGCGIGGSSGSGGGQENVGSGTCPAAQENCRDNPTIAKNMKRTYWYKK